MWGNLFTLREGELPWNPCRDCLLSVWGSYHAVSRFLSFTTRHFPHYWPFVQGIHLLYADSHNKPEIYSFDRFIIVNQDNLLNKQSCSRWNCTGGVASEVMRRDMGAYWQQNTAKARPGSAFVEMCCNELYWLMLDNVKRQPHWHERDKEPLLLTWIKFNFSKHK